MQGSSSREVNNIGEQNGVLFGLCCPTRRTNRSALVCLLPNKHFCSAICWFTSCSDGGWRWRRRRRGGGGGAPRVPAATRRAGRRRGAPPASRRAAPPRRRGVCVWWSCSAATAWSGRGRRAPAAARTGRRRGDGVGGRPGPPVAAGRHVGPASSLLPSPRTERDSVATLSPNKRPTTAILLYYCSVLSSGSLGFARTVQHAGLRTRPGTPH